MLVHIFEDEYLNHKDILLAKISYLIGNSDFLAKIPARKCNVLEITKDEAKKFLDANHIQGYCNSSVYVGSYYNNNLVGVMCFTKANKDNAWILSRYATDMHTICQGLGSKIFSYFIKAYNPDYVKSFLDRRWCSSPDSNLYTKMGFVLEDILKPEYRYIDRNNPTVRIHKFNLRKKELHRRYNFNMDMTEKQMVDKLGYIKIWDCGLYKYGWKKEGAE